MNVFAIVQLIIQVFNNSFIQVHYDLVRFTGIVEISAGTMFAKFGIIARWLIAEQ